MTTRNTNARFELAPQAQIERSTMDRSFNVKTSYNVGELVPFYVDEILPGDTFDIQTSKVVRLQTLLTPVMDNLYLDTYYFFVPNRLVWEHWRNFMGENTESAWIPQNEYTVPTVENPTDDNGWKVGTIADYMGIPTGITDDFKVNAMPFRAYAMIVNEWFRDENLQQPVNIPVDDTNITGNSGDNYITDLVKGGKPFIACKYHDYFTSCLPAPQKGPEINVLAGMAPVGAYDLSVRDYGLNSSTALSFRRTDGQDITNSGYVGFKPVGGLGDSVQLNYQITDAPNITTDNLFANLGLSTGTTVNQLRQAFAVQRLLERDARSGTRYIELIKAHFGVESPDARMQRPEYLGGNRVPFNIEQVTQTSSTNDVSPIGSQAGWSQTNDYSDDVHKSFTEHGFIIGLMCARYDHTYQQGIERFWQRKTRFDYYWPALAHIGEMAVKKSEIYAYRFEQDDVFGYQEAWADYRYKPNYITGEMRTQANGSLDAWHFGDYYTQTPVLSANWIKEDKNNVDRTLAVTSEKANQIFCDVMVDLHVTRPMPLYSIPGLIDHF